MDLYLILIAITALGFLSLLLIFWDSVRKWRTKKISSFKIITPSSNQPTEKIEPFIANPNNLGPLELQQSEQIFASLGFSALDGLLEEEKTLPIATDPIFYSENSSPYEAQRNTGHLTDSEQEELSKSKSINPKPITEGFHKGPSKPEFIVFYLLASQSSPFVGYELLQALLAADLRYGEMNIFHRYVNEYNTERPIFSVASAVEPGTFDLANIGAFSSPGLSLFLPLNHQPDIKFAFETMIETAEQLADDLAGELFDDQRKPLTTAKIKLYREKINLIVAKKSFSINPNS